MIIANRNLTLKFDAGEKKVEVAVFAPELVNETWICQYRIGWPDQPRTSFAAGVDSVQAVHLALQKIGMELYISPYHLSGKLKWEKAGDGYGFPVPKNGRDLLIGTDKVIDG